MAKTGVYREREIGVVEITGPERDSLLVVEEGHFLDLKGKDVTPEVGKHSFSIRERLWGELYVGVDESDFFGAKIREWRGFANQEDATGHIQSLEGLFPLGTEYSYEFLRSPGSSGLVLHITVQRTSQIAKTHDGKTFVRRSAHNEPVTTEAALNRLKLDKGIESFEKQTVDVYLSLGGERVRHNRSVCKASCAESCSQ